MIPNKLHYVYINERPWKLHHYLSVKSAIEHAEINDITIWLDKEPDGEWWEKTKPLVQLNFVDPLNIGFCAFKSKVLKRDHLVRVVSIDGVTLKVTPVS